MFFNTTYLPSLTQSEGTWILLDARPSLRIEAFLLSTQRIPLFSPCLPKPASPPCRSPRHPRRRRRPSPRRPPSPRWPSPRRPLRPRRQRPPRRSKRGVIRHLSCPPVFFNTTPPAFRNSYQQRTSRFRGGCPLSFHFSSAISHPFIRSVGCDQSACNLVFGQRTHVTKTIVHSGLADSQTSTNESCRPAREIVPSYVIFPMTNDWTALFLGP